MIRNQSLILTLNSSKMGMSLSSNLYLLPDATAVGKIGMASLALGRLAALELPTTKKASWRKCYKTFFLRH
jgi:hypothetical protein